MKDSLGDEGDACQSKNGQLMAINVLKKTGN